MILGYIDVLNAEWQKDNRVLIIVNNVFNFYIIGMRCFFYKKEPEMIFISGFYLIYNIVDIYFSNCIRLIFRPSDCILRVYFTSGFPNSKT